MVGLLYARAEIPAPAPGTRVGGGVREGAGRVSGAAPDADVPPDVLLGQSGGAEPERPAVVAESGSEAAVDGLQEPDQDGEEALVAEGEEGDLARRTGGEVVPVEKGEGADQRQGGAMLDTGESLDEANHIGGAAEGVHVAAAAAEPAIDAVGEGGGVGDGDVEGAGGFEHSADLADSAFEVDEVFQGVIADDRVEGRSRKKHSGRIARNIGAFAARVWNFEIETNDLEVGARRLEAAGSGPEVEDAGVLGQMMEKVHYT